MILDDILKKLEEYHKITDDNIIGVGYGYKSTNGIISDELSIIFTVKEKIEKDKLTPEQLLPETIIIDNTSINTDVVKGSYVKYCDESFYEWKKTSPSNRKTFRPLKCGISCSNITTMYDYSGTLGFLAVDNETNSLVGVSNNHVFVNDASICSERLSNGEISNIKGNIVGQKHESPNDMFPIGKVKRYYPIRQFDYNYAEVALTTIYSGQTYIDTKSSYNQEGLIPSTYQFATTEEINNLLVPGTESYNPLLYSAGRTTGAKGEGSTKLLVYQFPAVATISYDIQGVSTPIMFSDLILFVATTGKTQPISDICNYPIWHGDSGSALIADFSGTKKIIGLCFSGSGNVGLACRIDRVSSSINISAWNGEPVNYSSETIIEEITIDGLSDQEYITVSGKTYWQAGLVNEQKKN